MSTQTPQPGTARPTASLSQVAGRPLELLLAAALVAVPGAWLIVDAIRNFNDFRRAIEDDALSGWAVMLLLIAVFLFGAALLWVAYGLSRNEPFARGSTYVLAGSWPLGVILAADLPVFSGRGTAAAVGLGCVIASALVLLLAPGARPATQGGDDAPPTSIRMLQTFGPVVAVLLAVCGLAYVLGGLSADDDRARDIATGVILIAGALLALLLGPAVRARNPGARLAGAAAMLALIIAAFALNGQTLFVVPVELITFLTVAWIALWVINDARAWFGETPLTSATMARTTAEPAPAAPTSPPTAMVSDPPAQPAPVAYQPTITGEAPTTVADPPPAASTPPAASPSTAPPVDAPAPTTATEAPEGTVACTRCGTDIRPDDRFCRGCGASSADVRPPPPPPTCGSCGVELVSGDRFCANCGTRVAT